MRLKSVCSTREVKGPVQPHAFVLPPARESITRTFENVLLPWLNAQCICFYRNLSSNLKNVYRIRCLDKFFFAVNLVLRYYLLETFITCNIPSPSLQLMIWFANEMLKSRVLYYIVSFVYTIWSNTLLSIKHIRVRDLSTPPELTRASFQHSSIYFYFSIFFF